ncbi:hypothetical protein ACSLFT_28600 [Streptomyces sp. G6]|uniref:hypothetical protein n=1 Tax=Streptomyces sp. G6 TaxID=1178736 RepID=UPI003EDA2903
MTYHHRDHDNDLLTVSANTDSDGQPTVLIATTRDGIDIPLDRIEELVAGIRDTARQAATSGPPPEHVGRRVNAEDCPACSISPTPPPYPFLCPGGTP